MRPIHEVINKIKWDNRLKEKEFTVGYYDRIEDKIIEIPLIELKDDIPLHRIRYLKQKGMIVWDRDEKIDKI